MQNYAVIYPSLGMIAFTALSKFFNIENVYHQRALIIYINICFSIYVIFFDPLLDTPTMYFRGAHQMAINIINILGIEFLDSTMTIILLYSLRILHLVQNSPSIDITTIILGFGANLSLIIIVYFYNKAIRSQFLLTKMDQRWENILKQILHNQKFILINYQVEKLQFQSITSTFSPTIQSQVEVMNFLREAKVDNISLEQCLFYKLQEFSQKYLEIVNDSLNVKFDKQLIQVDFSIFFGNQPTILIQTSQSKLHIQNQEANKVSQLYLKLLTVFIKIIKEDIPFNYNQFHNLANKIQLQDKITQMWNKQMISKILSLKKSVSKIQAFCNPKSKIQLVGSDIFLNTIPKIFNLLLACILDSSTSELIIIKGESMENQLKIIKIQGTFNIRKLNQFTLKIKNYLLLICKEIKAEQYCINLELNEEILQPFNNNIMPQLHFNYSKKKRTQLVNIE
ncbi:unnamed protein product (macronuclear) [Paramecium tetraurelia]|uniref:Transmembrane protein n=1 Tax=Paramecium tetraurelia TaxID=5888 RepID=A0C8K9_PARTE|nr:uncharacterized protein GSPATT00036260001 [Paramecium tetraurelia]CAK67126.1 unnamed protein product [Paramecium tetraurelia]|eukprot:XP_001434523.1 hypothetical protein (macronuclear) [Paramecium tetraurelia strain d4-2]